MRHILDSSAWLECLENGPNTQHFAPLLQLSPELLVPAVVITEVRKVVAQQRGLLEAEAVTRAMCSCLVVPIDATIAVQAADLHAQHKLPLADSFIYAIALQHGATVWTQDSHFDGLPNAKFYPKIKPPTSSQGT